MIKMTGANRAIHYTPWGATVEDKSGNISMYIIHVYYTAMEELYGSQCCLMGLKF